MADFRTHVTTSSVLGVGYAGMGMTMGFPIESSIVAGGLCGVSGMLPDLDSDSGIPIRESTGFAAGIVPMLLVDRFQSFNLEYDHLVLIAACLYFLIRFAGASLLGRFTVHRGMWHSIPAVMIFAGLAFLVCGPAGNEPIRYLKAGGVFFGAMSHLCLDELYSIEWKGGTWRIKRSFGTALKFWSKNGWANFSTYAKLAVVGLMVAGEPSVNQYLETRYPELAGNAQRLRDAKEGLIDDVRSRVRSGESTMSPTPDALGNPESEFAPAPSSPWGASPSFPQQSPNTPRTTSPSYPPSGGGFSPNSGQPSIGSAEAVYRAGGGFVPR
ncbi:metal-dependent hydrolase [Aeoliella sp. ICT_H6.2]|uniref:Metal-dependent hydrolase n=1 Tax=Aeoliella straminimaris TaxID=2954799 RepID=A0A9X2FFD3_9BACT|nr:metal-dependent hydrolase [Aeoliella straminimaris]MCO6047724.1 metal-dependent hydrolase [Aeoliella straminimaris]